MSGQGALFGVTPLDPISFAMAPAVLLPVALAACLVPVLRASRVGPAEALRESGWPCVRYLQEIQQRPAEEARLHVNLR